MFVLGKKLKMSQIWKDEKIVPITIIDVLPNEVFLVRTKERDGYEAAQVGFGRHRRETAALGTGSKAGEKITVEAFAEGDVVRVVGYSKGRGFQGVVKRHGFGGGPKSHGQKDRLRAPGSIGATTPQRVIKGKKMAGRMGNERVTQKRMKVAGVDAEKNLLFIKGSIPGMRGSIVEISKVYRP